MKERKGTDERECTQCASKEIGIEKHAKREERSVKREERSVKKSRKREQSEGNRERSN